MLFHQVEDGITRRLIEAELGGRDVQCYQDELDNVRELRLEVAQQEQAGAQDDSITTP